MTDDADPKDKSQPRTAPRALRRRQLIDATIDSIAEHGISGTTMTTVTERAGLSQGIVNFHFQSKQNLFEETLLFLAREHRDLWRNAFDNAELTPQARLLAIADANFHPRICNQKKLAVWVAFYGEVHTRAAYRARMEDMDTERLFETKRLCRTICKAGYYDLDPAEVALTLEGLFDGLSLNILLYPEEFTGAKARLQIRRFLTATFPRHFNARQMTAAILN